MFELDFYSKDVQLGVGDWRPTTQGDYEQCSCRDGAGAVRAILWLNDVHEANAGFNKNGKKKHCIAHRMQWKRLHDTMIVGFPPLKKH